VISIVKPNIGRKMKAIIVLGILMLCMYAPSAFASVDDNITVRLIGGCDEELPVGKDAQVKSSKWHGNKLLITVLDNMRCGSYEPVSPSYSTSGGNLTLNWRWYLPPKGDVASCYCTRHLEFTITGLTKKKYKILLSKEAK
jgi:hypothetical protein